VVIGLAQIGRRATHRNERTHFRSGKPRQRRVEHPTVDSDSLDAYQQSLNIHQALPEQDKSNAGWQRDLIVSLYKLGTTTANIGGNDNVTQAQEFLRTALNLAELYTGPDRQKLIDGLNLVLRNLIHSD
jgi:hypothetical protein